MTMQTAAELDAFYAEQGCTCCGQKLNPKRVVWLELNFATGRYSKPGECPEAESQGAFPFGAACARNTLRQQPN
jgi:hypothetical protein